MALRGNISALRFSLHRRAEIFPLDCETESLVALWFVVLLPVSDDRFDGSFVHPFGANVEPVFIKLFIGHGRLNSPLFIL